MSQFAQKLMNYLRIAFGMIVLFAFVGNCAGRSEAAVMVLVFTVLFWGVGRIVGEAFQAYAELQSLKVEQGKEPPKEG